MKTVGPGVIPAGTLRVYVAALVLTQEKGYPPTLRELCAATGIRSPNGVAFHVRRLRAAGLLAEGGAREMRPLYRLELAEGAV